MNDFIEVDKGYYFVNYKEILRPNSGPNGQDMVIVWAEDTCVVNECGFELLGEASICLDKRMLD